MKLILLFFAALLFAGMAIATSKSEPDWKAKLQSAKIFNVKTLSSMTQKRHIAQVETGDVSNVTKRSAEPFGLNRGRSINVAAHRYPIYRFHPDGGVGKRSAGNNFEQIYLKKKNSKKTVKKNLDVALNLKSIPRFAQKFEKYDTVVSGKNGRPPVFKHFPILN